MKKYTVTILKTETYEKEFVVEADSEEDAADIVHKKASLCDVEYTIDNDYWVNSDYEVTETGEAG